MSLTYAQASDEILSLLKTAWDTTGHEMFYEDVRDQSITTQVPWAAVGIRHADGKQSTLGGTGQRQFLRLGTVIVSIFTPSGNGLSERSALAKVVADAFEGKSSSGGVWFRSVRVNEIGKDGTFFQTNVLVDFEYYELK